MSYTTLGRIVSVLGIIIFVTFALADMIGLGQSPDEIGYRQLLGVIAGALVISLGVYISRREPGSG
jgi:sulfite exporter TauE/SafE